MFNANPREKTKGVIMKKYFGLLIIVLILPLMSQQTAYAIPAILTDDIYYRPIINAATDGEMLHVGYGSSNPISAETTYLRFTLPEVNGGGNFNFHLGIYLQGAMNTLSSYIGVYVVPDDAITNPRPMSIYYPTAGGGWTSSNALAFQQISYSGTPGYIFFDFTIPVDSTYYAGLMDGVLTIALAAPTDSRLNGNYYFSSMTGMNAPNMDYVDPPAVPEPSTLILFGVGLLGIAIMYAKRVSLAKAK